MHTDQGVFMKRRYKAILALTTAAVALAPLNAAEAATFGQPVATYYGNTAIFGSLVNALCSGLVTLTNALGQPINTTAATAVTKTVTRSDNPDSSTDFKVVIAGAIPATFTTVDVLDCVWIDSNNDGVQQLTEPMRSYRALAVAIAGAGASRTVTFELNVPAAVGKTVCDRAFGVSWNTMQNMVLTNPAGIISGSWLALYTPKACAAPTPPVDVPEVGITVLLTLSGIGTATAVLHIQRRRLLAVA
jgi:hypothetical protein